MTAVYLGKLAESMDNRAGAWLARILCGRLRWHTAYCRGRRDHVREGRIIDPGRWSR